MGDNLLWERSVGPEPLSVLSTDFTDAQGDVTGWSWRFGDGEISRIDLPGYGGKYIRLVHYALANSAAWSMLGSLGDCEVLAKHQAGGGSPGEAGLYLRGGGSAAAGRGYFFFTSNSAFAIAKYVGDSYELVTTAYVPYPFSVSGSKAVGVDYCCGRGLRGTSSSGRRGPLVTPSPPTGRSRWRTARIARARSAFTSTALTPRTSSITSPFPGARPSRCRRRGR